MQRPPDTSHSIPPGGPGRRPGGPGRDPRRAARRHAGARTV